MHFGETVQVHLQNLNQQYFFIRPAEARSEVTIKLEKVRLGKALGLVERALDGREYRLAGGFSAADIALGCTVAISHAFRPLDAEPRLLAYVARLKARPAVGNLLDLELPPLA